MAVQLSKVWDVTKITTAVSMVCALIAVAVSLWQIRNDYNKTQVREWQEVVVYSIVSDAPLNGLKLDEIQKKYKQAVEDYHEVLPREEIQTQALKRTLLNLMANRAIVIRNDGVSYGLALDGMNIQGLVDATKSLHMQDVGNFVLSKVHGAQGKYAEDELRLQVRAAYPDVSDEDFSILISQMITQGVLSPRNDGKFWLGTGAGPSGFGRAR